MTLSVLVVDDEPLARRGVIVRLARHPDMHVLAECGDGESALAAIVREKPDLMFMDIQMPGLSGLEALGLLAPHERPTTIFLTAYDRFALQAFEVHALDYLLKPIDDDRFNEALDRARVIHSHRAAETAQPHLQALLKAKSDPGTHATRFMVRIGNRVQWVAVDDLDWVEAMGDYAGLHVGNQVHLLRETLHQLSQRLDPTKFVRIHRSTIVRVSRIREMQSLPNRDGLLRLRDETSLRVSRTYIDALRSTLAATQFVVHS
ncbi:MAG: LytTR family transcriptional regulator DNA-binding domain-containing protein [Pseudomonadota bacterium]|nr:LytTR family transcriptional regulator DNA-binding domain-containing protein [Pseudomonadota bacterium]